MYNTDLGTNTFYPQNILLITMNLTLVFGFYALNKNDWQRHCQANVIRFHAASALVVAGIWALTMYPLLDEMYLLCVAVSVALLLLLCTHVTTRHSDSAARTLLGMDSATARLGPKHYRA